MKRISVFLLSMLLVLGVNGVLNAAPITFSEVPLGTTDPIIAGVSFWAGDPTALNDTITDDSWTPGNPYLLSGYDDGTGKSPGIFDTFVGVNLTTPGDLFGTVSFDISAEAFLPPSTTLWLIGLLGGVPVGSMSLIVGDNNYHNVSFIYGLGADTLFVYDDLDASGFGTAFHIDNFEYASTVIPEPATMLLLASGLAGGWFLKRKKRT